MAPTSAPPARTDERSLGYAYLMIGVAIGCICVSGVLGSIFSPDLVSTSGTSTGFIRQHIPLAAYSGWIWNVAAIAVVLPVAMRGIRAQVTDRAAWTLLGLGTGGIWLAVMFVSIFAPVMVTGTAPWLTWVPLASMLSVVAGLIVTVLLSRFVKSAFFEPPAQAPPPAASMTVQPTATPDGHERPAEDAATKLRQLSELHDSGVITDAEFQRKKNDLLSRM